MSLRKMSMTTEATWEHGKHVAGEQVTILAAGIAPLFPNTLVKKENDSSRRNRDQYSLPTQASFSLMSEALRTGTCETSEEMREDQLPTNAPSHSFLIVQIVFECGVQCPSNPLREPTVEHRKLAHLSLY